MDSTQRKWDRIQLIKGGMLVAAFAVFALLTEWVMNQEQPLQIGLQLNASMLLLYALGAFLFLRGQWRTIKPEALFVALAALALALLMRLGMFDVASDDYTYAFRLWLDEMEQYEGGAALTAEIGNYNMPYLYLLLLIVKFRPMHALAYMKLMSIPFELVAAYAVSGLAGEYTEKRSIRNVVFLVALCIPTVVLNGACWAQCDAMYASLALLGILYGVKRRSMLCYAFMALAFSFKMQAAFVMPMVIVLILCGRVRVRDVWVFFATFLLTLVPAILAGRSFASAMSIYIGQVGGIVYLCNQGTSWLAWIGVRNMDMPELKYMALGLAFAACLAFLYYCYLRRKRLDTQALLEGAFLCSVMLPFLLPYIHDRYFYCAELLALVYWLMHPKRWPVPAAVWLSGWMVYLWYLLRTPEPAIPVNVMAIAICLVLCYVGTQFVRRVEALPEPAEAPCAKVD